MFFGTPFHGIEGGDGILKYVKQHPEKFGTEILPYFINFMRPDSAHLKELRRAFIQCQDGVNTKIHCIYETQRAESDDPLRPKPVCLSLNSK